jgi:hypothetical protein
MRSFLRKKIFTVVVTVGLVLVFANLFLQEEQTFSRDDSAVCAQVITPGRNPQTGEVRDFKTPCDVPKGWDTLEVGGGREITRNGITSKVYWNSNIGLSFEYTINPNGYTLFEHKRKESDPQSLVTHIAIRNTKDYEALVRSTPSRESPSEISVRVFENNKNQDVFTWLNENATLINYDKEKQGLTKATVGGVEAIVFFSDGLYMQKNYVLTSNGKTFFISGVEDGSFVEDKKEFERFLASIILF